MSVIENLNSKYLECIKRDGLLSQAIEELKIAEPTYQTIDKIIKKLNKGMENESAFLKQLASTLSLIVKCERQLKSFEETYIDSVNSASYSNNESEADALLNVFKKAENSLNSLNNSYSVLFDTPESLKEIALHKIKDLLNQNMSEIGALEIEAKTLIMNYEREIKSISIGAEITSEKTVSLPESMIIGCSKSKTEPLDILKRIGIMEIYNPLYIDMRNNGNVFIETDYEHTQDSELDEFVLAYIFKILESFPIGTVNVHIFDRNPNRYNQRLHNAFNDGNYSESAKKTIRLYDYNSLSELGDIATVIREDIFRKTNLEYPDLYALHDIDKSDVFNLFILRDGLIDQGGYQTATTLDLIESLTKPNESGHVSGIRFLIIDDSVSHKSSINDNAKMKIAHIYDNSEIHISYLDGSFRYKEENVNMLSLRDKNWDVIVQNRAVATAKAITSLEKQYVSISDVSAKNTNLAANDSIIWISVGKSGNDIISIPFSCRDDNNTVEGQCIGYMVIGQSGSGKSSFFHSVIINGCLSYSPAELQFWLLDFKFGGASSKYKNSEIPHVKIVSENNKIDDALCLFQMIEDEMEIRNKLMIQKNVDNIIEYNNAVPDSERIPRIIVMIDEVQEIFRDDNASVIKRMISETSVRMRSVGMHYVMVAQHLSDGKSYMLKEAFLPSAAGRICFRIAENLPRESGFGQSFIQRKDEISNLPTGEAYVSWGGETIKKVKMAYAPQDDMNKQFRKIRDKYSDYLYMKPHVIGSKKRLSINAIVQTRGTSYFDAISSIRRNSNTVTAIIGEDAYRMDPLEISFSSVENSSLLVLGDDKGISSSICTSISISLMRQHCKAFLFNADRTKQSFGGTLENPPFMYLCNIVGNTGNRVSSYRLDQFLDIVGDLYDEYRNRLDIVQKSENSGVPSFEDLYLIVNDLFGIESFKRNDTITKNSADYDLPTSTYSIFGNRDNSKGDSIQNALSIMLKDGYKYNIHVVLAIKGDPANWRNMRPTDVNNAIIFNSTQYISQVENQYYVKEMLSNISSDRGEETLAVWINKKHISKIRPIIYDMSKPDEVNSINAFLEVR
ncbi:MAG: hypothetical protein IJ869_05885 [Clostridiales bacterium]|nr:hypothetical protein [Clostridiales bacterium]